MVRRLECSFCGKDETQVKRLVAGGKTTSTRGSAYICDECVSLALDMMSQSESPTATPAGKDSLKFRRPRREDD
jgi:ATP-dependent Clp protease ATP-binding subunit ClpX